MGFFYSKPSPPSPLLETPWREITWGRDNRIDLQYLKNFQPQNKEATIRVLLYGPVGAGKSSFINSVNNVLQGRMTHEAVTCNKTTDHFTKNYQTYKIKKEGRENFYPFVFNDIMGLEDGNGRGVRTEDIKLALKGHVKDGYKFNPASPLCDGDPCYNSSPSISDRVHVLVCIYDANASEMKSSVLEKMKEIREAASDLRIPQLAILTHIDSACGETEKNLRDVYKSKHLKKKMGDFSSSLGIPMNCILPVKNYSDETQLNPDVNTLILNALKLMIDFGDDYANKLVCPDNVKGGNSSTPSPPPAPPPSPLLETPWREITWGGTRQALKSMQEFQPENEEATIRVLLYGPVGAGKSSFINSVNNVLQGRMTNEALASATTSDQSFTKTFKTYKIKKGSRGNFHSFVFNDIMGLEERTGVRTDDIKMALKGHVKDGYKFNPVSSLLVDDPGYNSSPSISDRVHVLVCIYDANAPQIKPSVLQKMREIREAASDLDIPQLAILTHIDVACEEAKRDLRNVYRSKHLKKKMDEFSSSLGIPMNCIFPVKNYSDETELNSDVDALILNALKLMINFGDDYADKLLLKLER